MKFLAVCLLGALSIAAAQPSVRDELDCKMRTLALEFANHIQPFRPASAFLELRDALNGSSEKAAGCAVPDLYLGVAGGSRFGPAPPILRGATGVFFVDALNGADSNPGTQAAPVRTIPAALALSRAAPSPSNSIVLRGGTHYLTATIALGAADSGLTVQAFPGEEAWVSGAKPLPSLTWTPYKVSNSTANKWVEMDGQNAVYGAAPGSSFVINGTYTSWAECQAMCEADHAAGGLCTIWTWHDTTVEAQYRQQCWFRLDGVWDPHAESGHFSGHLAGPAASNIWQASLSGVGINNMLGLRLNGARATRARFPNGFPETKGFMPPAVFRASWTPQSSPHAPDTQIDIPSPVRNTSVSAFWTFTSGIGGTCDRFQPNAGYWCSNSVQGGGSVIYYVPTAMNATTNTLPNSPYANAVGAIVQTWRPGHWASWMYEVGSTAWDAASNSTNFVFSRGGFQGSRGENEGEDTYIENVIEELDAANEYFYNASTQMLYYYFNGTVGTPPPADGFVVPQVSALFNITGATQSAPIRGVTLTGIGLRDTSYTYMDPHSIPSGGDWTLERSAVVFIENSEAVSVTGCVFERVDGNALMLSAYNRNATVDSNEFAWIGATAVAAWGNTDGGDARLPAGYGLDGSAGQQPRGSRITRNLCHELGIWEKQSSCYTQFKASENIVQGNIMYNGPRAHVNFNDGFRGGALLQSNLILNSCRESGDHGPFNSWDRDPYTFDDVVTGELTMVKAMDHIDANFIIANGNSLGAIDNDDGSSYYNTTNNFFVYGGGGLKNDFEGHDNVWSGNVVAFAGGHLLHNGYGGQVGTPGKGILDGHVQQFFNNKAVVSYSGSYAKPICSGRGTTIMHDNTVFNPDGKLTTDCGSAFDVNAKLAPFTPTMADDILSAARAVLWRAADE